MFDLIKAQLEDGILVFPSILVLVIIFAYLLYRLIRNLFPAPVMTDFEEFIKLIGDAGCDYDPNQDIFYSKMNAWQRKCGYCRLYDEAAAPVGMIIDAEPIRFEYGGKRWLIQFWKGQYHLSTGCEIGVYYTEEPDLDIPDLFRGAFYRCADNGNRLDMAFTLYKNGRELFHRQEKHWWLTGFKTGEFSEPWELTMRIRLVLKDHEMCRSFVRAMKKAGYREAEMLIDGAAVEFTFDKPRTPQPLTRVDETDWIAQRNNERLCSVFREITGEDTSWPEKLSAMREKGLFLYSAVINIGKTREIFKVFERLKSYI